MEESRVDKKAVESALQFITGKDGRFTIPELRDFLKRQGFSYGSYEELLDFAERQKTRYFVGQLIDENGKRKYISTQQQLLLEFGYEHIYCKAELVRKESEEEKKNLLWLRKHMIALIKRTPLLPQWAINEIVAAIDNVFERMKGVA